MKRILLAGILVCVGLLVQSCGGSSSGTDTDDTGATFATYGSTMAAVVPDGLKVGGANLDIAASISKELTGTCAANFTNCPYMTEENGGDSDTGEILMRLWGLDYNGECTNALITAGTCFNCVDCDTGATETTNFIEPTMLADPTACATTSTSDGHYVNMGVDPCFFDAMIADITNVAECETTSGGSVDISSAIPWYASWDIPQTVNFSSYYDRGGSGNMWWTVNNGTSGADQYFLSLDSNWLYAGIKNSEDNFFMFFGTGSPAYYVSNGEDSGINISAYTGPLDAITTTFEVMQFRDQGANQYVERLRSNGNYLWYQKYDGANFPSTSADVETVKDSPTSNRCVLIGTNAIVESKYVPLADCVTSFNAASIAELNLDSNYTLKMIDAETAGAIQFTTSLTPTVTTSSCLAE